MSGEVVLFSITAFTSVVGALGMLVSKKSVHSALWLALTMLSLALLYVVQSAVFLGIVQVVVYTGAVMMLFLFVLMIIGVDSSEALVETLKGQRWLAILAAVGFSGLLIAGISRSLTGPPVGMAEVDAQSGGNVQAIAFALFSDYVAVFELTAALLITATIGALVLAHRERLGQHRTQRDLSRMRFLGGGDPGPLPAPGTYARHNAVDTPALLPDGSVAISSVPAPMLARGTVRPVDLETGEEVKEISEGRGL